MSKSRLFFGVEINATLFDSLLVDCLLTFENDHEMAYREKSQFTIIFYAVKSNRVSIHCASTKTISNHDDNPRSWIKFKVDIVIAVVETTLQKVSTKLLERA